MADGFDDLDALTLSPEQVAATKPLKPHRQRKTHVAGAFYLCPVERAAATLSSAGHLIIALRLYRLWRLRKPGDDTIVASNAALAGSGFTRETKRRALLKLQAAGLLEVVDSHHGRSPRLRIVEVTVSTPHSRCL
jgi:hypothetical protein